ncbi:hypothetical protein [Candidatus Endomicrobiellum agilis]|uniref:hypothetical protein n=1 Tax=Candidatus Endomicrobiellum agilis TaxID=3238957 RepID=UPI0035775F99|nr:hypothetical protein [Endomicrobium sp.]
MKALQNILKETRNIYISVQSLIKRLLDKFGEPPRELIELCEDIKSSVYRIEGN